MKRALPLLLAAMLAMSATALAKDFVQDQAGMLSPDVVQQLNARIGNFNAQTGKEIIVQTVASVAGANVSTAAQNAFSQQQVNGVLIFVDKGDRKDWIVPDRAAVQAGWWTSATSSSIAQAMQAQFRAGDYDGGITTAVNQSLDIYRSHLSSLRGSQPSSANAATSLAQTNQGMHISVFWWIIIALFAFLIIRSIMRAAAGPRAYGGGMSPGAPGYGPGGYGPGYGGGYGWGGGGGFWSGLLGGLGGAWLGNEMFGRQNIGTGAWGNVDPTGAQPPADAGGWQSDPGQAGMGAGGGDWGGGGFGGGDMGGGGFGAGGGDMGGGGGGW